MSTTPHEAAWASSPLSVNTLAAPLVQALLRDADVLGVRVQRDASGVCIVDAGIEAPGSVAAGTLIGEICMGGLGRVRLACDGRADWPDWLEVHSAQPVLACLGSQYAGWSLAASKEETGGKKFFSLGSGPARALAGKEALFTELGYRDKSASGVIVLEVDRVPPTVVVQKVLRDCGLQPEQLTIILTPTSSLAGTTQVVARVLEVALHKAHECGFALADIADGSARAPLPSPTADGVQAMGRTNDAILYGGTVRLSVRGTAEAALDLAKRLPSHNSKDYGRGFADIFQAVEYDFYKIDPALFAPAEVYVSHLPSGQTWHAGKLNMPLLLGLWCSEA
ncbi:MAG: methenyltetrahydromethanopterin cyclohydrolase [Vitreoscilla sp.]|nr:methenyltetrahydromethanopterin cyclohydrolase [Burkholderiales bacterium]MBP6339359.1 methenyltetrahydromethanopterin cyclohydrolase [Vitreoscilla sp.]MBP6675907.1 methenyltetrahydromethanopterin cyclohydrolase [Vitreoscilla sp.]